MAEYLVARDGYRWRERDYDEADRHARARRRERYSGWRRAAFREGG
jgi:hypothetical protein